MTSLLTSRFLLRLREGLTAFAFSVSLSLCVLGSKGTMSSGSGWHVVSDKGAAPSSTVRVAAGAGKVRAGIIRRRPTKTVPKAKPAEAAPATAPEPAQKVEVKTPVVEPKVSIPEPETEKKEEKKPVVQKPVTKEVVTKKPVKEEEKKKEQEEMESEEEEEEKEEKTKKGGGGGMKQYIGEEPGVNAEDVLSETTFDQFGLSPWLVESLHKRLHVERATKIQNTAIPALLGDRDTFIKAETGSGKTLAYAIPLAQRLGSLEPAVSRADGAVALIVAPTRELCQQIFGVVQVLFTTFIGIVPGVIVGGQKRTSEKARLRKGLNIVVATPGRLVDHIQTTQTFDLRHVLYLVLDEADRLLDMGFQRALSQIICALDRAAPRSEYAADRPEAAAAAAKAATLPEGKVSRYGLQRRNVLVSATLSRQVQQLAYFSLREPAFVDPTGEFDGRAMGAALGRVEYEMPAGLKQWYVVTEMKERLAALGAFLRGRAEAGERVIVFFSSIDAVEFHHALFSRAQLQYLYEPVRPKTGRDELALVPAPLYRLHGDLTQVERSAVYDKFRAGASGIIFCTDVAARGIDLPNVNWIVQYDPPGEVADYIHRVGRTARIGHTGNALLFMLPSEVPYIDLLAQKKVVVEQTPLADFYASLVLPGAAPLPPARLAELAHYHQIHFEHIVLDNPDVAELARKGFISYMRAYATHSRDTAAIFIMKKLHLGHLAKSFALREAPTVLKQNIGGDFFAQLSKRSGGTSARHGPGAGTGAPQRATDTRKVFGKREFAGKGLQAALKKGSKKKKGAVSGFGMPESKEPRTPISAFQGARRARKVMLSEFSDGVVSEPSTKKPKSV